MNTWRLFFTVIAFAVSGRAFGQTADVDGKFSVDGVVAGRDTGVVVLWSMGADNLTRYDTAMLKSGKFRFSGTVNGACEAYLWTDTSTKIFDDPSMLRFILEPGKTHIFFKVADPIKPVVTGGKGQQEKTIWDERKESLLSIKRMGWDTMRVLGRELRGSDSATVRKVLERVENRGDSVNRVIRQMDVGYIRRHPNSFLSAYLLWQQERRLTVDSIEIYYGALSSNVKNSSIGLGVLEYVYPPTDNNEFRKANPLINAVLGDELDTIHSVYQLRLKDTSGRTVALSGYNTKYLVIDFWASWCGPCVRNIPHLNQLIENYDGDSIGFISISLDKHIGDWKRALSQHPILGVQLCDSNSFDGVAAIFCKTIYVGNYVIADRDGRIIHYNAPQADEPALKVILDGLLQRSGNGGRRR
jgi:thiol-disulfide isomerase/thioredoxin